MHTGLLCMAVRDTLRDALEDYARTPFRREEIEIMPDEKPPARCGEKFISVYGNDWSADEDDNNVGLNYLMGVSCTLTFRTTVYPQTHKGPEAYAKMFTGMASVCLKIAKEVSQYVNLFSRLQEYDEFLEYYDPTNDVYVGNVFEYLRFQNCDPNPIPVYADHFSAENESGVGGEQIMGHIMTVTFGRARAGLILENVR